jgi:hypothetical protein
MTATLLFKVKVETKTEADEKNASAFVNRVRRKLEEELQAALADKRVEVRITSFWQGSVEFLILILLPAITTAVDIAAIINYIEQIVIGVIHGQPETRTVSIQARESSVLAPQSAAMAQLTPQSPTMPQTILTSIVAPAGIIIAAIIAGAIVFAGVNKAADGVNNRIQELTEQLKEARASLERQTIALGSWSGNSDTGRLTDVQRQIDQLIAKLARVSGSVDERTER